MAYESDPDQRPRERRQGLGSRLWAGIKRVATSRTTSQYGVYTALAGGLVSLVFPPAGVAMMAAGLALASGSFIARKASEYRAAKRARDEEGGQGLPSRGYPDRYPYPYQQPFASPQQAYPYQELGQGPTSVTFNGVTIDMAPGILQIRTAQPQPFQPQQAQWVRPAQATDQPRGQVPPLATAPGGEVPARAGGEAGAMTDGPSAAPEMMQVKPALWLLNPALGVRQFNPDRPSAGQPSSSSSEPSKGPWSPQRHGQRGRGQAR